MSFSWRAHFILTAAALLISAGMLFLCPPVSYADGPSDWPMFGQNPAHTGYNEAETKLRPPLRLKWIYPSSPRSGDVVVGNGVIYYGVNPERGTDHETLSARDAVTGALRWNYNTPPNQWGYSAIGLSPSVANGMVYVDTVGGGLHALNASTGELKWQFKAGDGGMRHSPTVADGVVYFSDRWGIQALDAMTGVSAWTFAWPAPPVYVDPPSPSVVSGTVYLSADKVYALDGASGALKWSYPGRADPPAVSNGIVYVRSYGGALCALDADTGETKWTYGIYSQPVVANGAVYLADSGTVYALDASSGKLLWSTWYPVGVGSLAGANGIIYGGLWSGLIALDAKSGRLAWAYSTGNNFGPMAPILANGLLYSLGGSTGSVASAVVAYESQPPPVGVYPRSSNSASPSFSLSWTIDPSWTGVPAEAYDIQFRDVAAGDWVDMLASTAMTSTTFGGQDGHTYYFRARSRTEDGSLGDWGDPAGVTVDLTPPAGALSIGGGFAYANSITATLTLTATDATNGVADVSLSNDGAGWSPWEPYNSSRSWTLAPGPDGLRTAYARFRDLAGNVSATYSDTIILDTTPPSTPIPDDSLTGTIISPTVTFTWPEAGDGLSGLEGYYHKVDCGAETATTAVSTTISSLFDASHTFYVRARDRAGNYSPYGKHDLDIRATSLSAPSLNQPGSPTVQEKITTGGVAQTGATVRIFANCAPVGDALVGSDGAWQLADVPLAMGENVLAASTVVSGTGLSPISVPASVLRLKAITSSQPGPARALLADSGGSLSAGKHLVQIGPGALLTDTQVALTPYGTGDAPSLYGKASVGAFASVVAVDRGTGAPAQLQKPVTVTLSYDIQTQAVISPTLLTVRYYDRPAGAWVPLPSQVDTVARTVSAQSTHLSDFALLADVPRSTYLPVLMKGPASAW